MPLGNKVTCNNDGKKKTSCKATLKKEGDTLIFFTNQLKKTYPPKTYEAKVKCRAAVKVTYYQYKITRSMWDYTHPSLTTPALWAFITDPLVEQNVRKHSFHYV